MPKLYPALAATIAKLESQPLGISEERKHLLDQMAQYIRTHPGCRLVFICTHNSRRSHMAQLWAAALAIHYGVKVYTYSGGTEATAVHPNAVAALQKLGFVIEEGEGTNPMHKVWLSANASPIEVFSKTFDDPANPSAHFAAIMTCADADENCPFVPGADARFAFTFDDPKVADGTPGAAAAYLKKAKEIGQELIYVFIKAKH
jgi:hypothetical protein